MVKKNKKKLLNKRGQMNIPDAVVTPVSSSAPEQNLFTFDTKTKETVIASITALVIAQMIIFFGDFLVGQKNISAVVNALIFAVLGGAISGFILAKFYDQLMSFVANKFKFLLPLSNTFFKLLFLPAVIGAIVGLVLSILTGGLFVALGASLGGVGGGILGGLFGGSLILSMIWSILLELAARFIYAKYMIFKVGKYYRDYKEQ